MDYLRIVLTIVLGAIPATMLGVFPLGLVLVGASSMEQGDIAGGVMGFLWAFAAAYGTIALWVVAFRGLSILVVLGLVAGLLAMSPFIVGFVLEPRALFGHHQPYSYLFALPPLVAFAWLIGGCVAPFIGPRTSASDDDGLP